MTDAGAPGAMPPAGGAWVFDVDGTLIDSLSGTSLRPLARTLLETLRRQGITVILWSAGGGEYAKRRAESLGFGDLVDAYYDKETRGADGRWLTDHFHEDHVPATFIDDRPEEVPGHAHILAVRPYIGAHDHDRGLAEALQIARSHPFADEVASET